LAAAIAIGLAICGLTATVLVTAELYMMVSGTTSALSSGTLVLMLLTLFCLGLVVLTHGIIWGARKLVDEQQARR
jgi:hypothetical protein